LLLSCPVICASVTRRGAGLSPGGGTPRAAQGAYLSGGGGVGGSGGGVGGGGGGNSGGGGGGVGGGGGLSPQHAAQLARSVFHSGGSSASEEELHAAVRASEHVGLHAMLRCWGRRGSMWVCVQCHAGGAGGGC